MFYRFDHLKFGDLTATSRYITVEKAVRDKLNINRVVEYSQGAV